MGSLETGLSLKRDQSRIERHPFGQKPRSRFMKFVLFKKIGYLQWVCTVAVFFFFVVIFQMFLPGSVMEKSENSWKGREVDSGDSMVWKEFGGLDFGEGVKFEPLNLLGKFRKESREVNLSSVGRSGVGFGYRKPQLALVSSDSSNILFFLLMFLLFAVFTVHVFILFSLCFLLFDCDV